VRARPPFLIFAFTTPHNLLIDTTIGVKVSPQKSLRRSVPKIITRPALTERTKKVKDSRLNHYLQTTYAKLPQEVNPFSLARTLRARPAFFVFCLHLFTPTAEHADIQNNKGEGN
jgi:hypothetical protein